MMTTYMGFSIYSVSIFRIGQPPLQQWRVQSGYEVLGDYQTLAAAKAAITRKWSKYDV